MVRAALIALLVSGCAAGVMAGAAMETTAAVSASGMQRKAGGCYANCTGGAVCNPRSGLCEKAPCDGTCGAGEHCESSFSKSWCAPGAASDVVSQAPGTEKTLPVLPPPPPIPSGPPQVVPAAEQYVPPGK